MARGDDALAAAGGTGRGAGFTGVAAVIGAGLAASIVLMQLTLQTLPHLGEAIARPAFWLKVGFVSAMTAAAWISARTLARPGARGAALPALLAAPLALLWLVGAVLIVQTEPDQRAQLFWGSTWRTCPASIALLSAPLLAAALWAMRRMAPTRLRLAAGAGGALVYCLHCPEISPVFVGSWYLVGMLVPTALGALLGPKLLAW